MTRIGFVADDLTGASDVLAQAHARGLRAALVLDPKTEMPQDVDVIGVAGPMRALEGDALREAVHANVQPFVEHPPEVLLYKVCSTFDSSPTIGSIGDALRVLHQVWPAHGPIPVAPAQPEFGRYVAFSNLFGRAGATVHRLDRHPVMSRHPATPMTESDLRRVLEDQLPGDASPEAIMLPAFADESFEGRWQELRAAATPSAFVVDATDPAHLDRIAQQLLSSTGQGTTNLVVGSGGIMAALARQVNDHTATSSDRTETPSRASGPVLAVSASASTTTSGQIDAALQAGWVDIAIPPEALSERAPEGEWMRALLAALREGHNVVAHTLRGPDDPRMHAGRPSSTQVGGTLGRIVERAVAEHLTRDVAILGGDTSSHALAALRVRELRVAAQFVMAGPICRSDDDAAIAGCRVLLKGGQVGPEDVLTQFATHESTTVERND